MTVVNGHRVLDPGGFDSCFSDAGFDGDRSSHSNYGKNEGDTDQFPETFICQTMVILRAVREFGLVDTMGWIKNGYTSYTDVVSCNYDTIWHRRER